ncbi:MDR family NADPH-dependent oxidoreductase [Sphingobium chlorophenolicum]|uniref:enoyl-[acyl-carrier-protein] reductase n=1 Tax=Sphingobium chlorophenolicum TaxID=46429 RepID=A0A081RDG2_SPHCR|nr:2-enoyl thioester reductase domain-containing protein [Sphingobium chlorophenolicum]KEQ53235.1 Alcohol dehydrogenase GroES domain protein [Sphingobium chlorophenolicum]
MNCAVLPGEKGHVRLADAPVPSSPSGDEVLVRMAYAPINPADLLAIDGRYSFDLSHDQPLGAEGAGWVEAVGDAVADLRPGDLVMPLSRGNWCAQRLLPRAHLMALPAGFDPVQAAMLRINPPTAHLLLRHSSVRPGDALIQNGAGSVVAHWVRTFAARMDIRIIDVVRRPHSAMSHALLDGDGLAERARAASGGRPIRAALDCVAGTATGRLASCLAPGGRLMLFGHLSGEPIQVRSQLLTGGGLSIAGFSLRPAEAALGAEGLHAMFGELAESYAADPPSLPVRAIVPLSRVEEGIALARVGGSGRVLFDLTQ